MKTSLDYCIKTWDSPNTGVNEEPLHNTYDIEFWGPDGMCSSFYLGALQSIIENECGHWYTKAMSMRLTGVSYDAFDKTRYVDSKIGDLKSFLTTETGFGNVQLKDGKVSVNMVYGTLDVKNIIMKSNLRKTT